MKKQNLVIIFGLLVIALMLTSCGEPTIKGEVSGKLDKSILFSGEQTKLTVEGKNTGDLPFNAELRVTSEDPSKVITPYIGSLESELQPGESVIKVLNVQGFSDYSSTTYWIKIELINKNDSSIIDSLTRSITVKK